MKPTRAELKQRMQAFGQTCRRSGLRVTPQRTEIFRVLAATHEHPDAETVHRRIRKRMPNVSLDTVYRTLHRLEEEGLVSRVGLTSDRSRFDGNAKPHHHFVCKTCGLVKDFLSKRLDRFRAPREVRSWGDVHSSHIEVRGVCSKCLAKSRRRRKSKRETG